MSVEVGTLAPDFTLPDSDRAPMTLSDFRGDRAVLVVFYPFAFSGVCTKELSAVRDELATFQNDRVQVVAISTDPAPTLQAWAAAQDYHSRCCPISGRTAPLPRFTGSSTKRVAWPCGVPSWWTSAEWSGLRR